MFNPSPLQMIAAAAVGLVMGAIVGWGVEFSIGFFMLFVAVAYGGFAGEMIMRASGRKRGIKMEVLAAVSMAVGAIGGRMLIAGVLLASHGSAHPPHGVLSIILQLFVPSPIPIAVVCIAIGSAVSRIRYI